VIGRFDAARRAFDMAARYRALVGP